MSETQGHTEFMVARQLRDGGIKGLPVHFSPFCPADMLVDRGNGSVVALDAQSVFNVLDWWNAIEDLWPRLRGMTGLTLWDHCQPISARGTMWELPPVPYPSWRNPHNAWPHYPPVYPK